MPCILLCCTETGVVATSEHGHKLKDVQDAAPSSPANAGAASSAAARRIEYLPLAMHFAIIINDTSMVPRREAHQEALTFSGLIGGSWTVAARFSLVPRSTPLSSV